MEDEMAEKEPVAEDFERESEQKMLSKEVSCFRKGLIVMAKWKRDKKFHGAIVTECVNETLKVTYYDEVEALVNVSEIRLVMDSDWPYLLQCAKEGKNGNFFKVLQTQMLASVKGKVEKEMDEEDASGREGKEPIVPRFPHIGTVVRKRKDRQKLSGFDCRQCRDWYESKKEAGLTEEQTKELKNKHSRHRALFQKPDTPDNFWDPLILEDDSQDPRSKTQTDVAPLRRGKRNKSKLWLVEGEKIGGEEFEMTKKKTKSLKSTVTL